MMFKAELQIPLSRGLRSEKRKVKNEKWLSIRRGVLSDHIVNSEKWLWVMSSEANEATEVSNIVT